MPLEIIYQDQWLAVVNKPAGMLVHPGREPEPPDQIAMKVLRDQIGQRVFTVHRLDRPTSGLLLFALDSTIEAALRKQFEEQSVKKNYKAIALGDTEEKWTSREPLQKNEGEPRREAETRFEEEGTKEIEGNRFTRLSVYPKTGRFHQIRKHLAATQNPIVGDYLYGDPETMDQIAELTGQSRLMLHSSSLTFYHPVEGIDLELRCPLPDRFAPFL